jgi:hypothetical protein
MPTSRSGTLVLALVTAAAVALPVEAAAQRRDRDLIVREELLQSAQKSQDLHQAIRSLRPHFLQGQRGPRTMPGDPPRSSIAGRSTPTPVIYVNGNRLGNLDVLSSILTVHVDHVRYLNPNTAAMQLGPGHDAGAILVVLSRGPAETAPPGD